MESIISSLLVLIYFFQLQLGIGFLLRERPVFALATVATVVVRPLISFSTTTELHYLSKKCVVTGNLDSVPLYYGCLDSLIPLLATPLLQLVLLTT